MGNLIKDFWTYTYGGKQYFGICEVVAGEDLGQNRNIKKYETHIEKALKYLMVPGNDIVSHMSIQKYTSFLKDRTSRLETEDTYYPFFMEFESKYTAEYQAAAGEALKAAYYLIYELGVHEKDVLMMINNSRSIYIMINPKVYGLKPSPELHKIYRRMYDKLNEELSFKYVDTSLYGHYNLMKTPNSYYKGGYFVPVSLDELKALFSDPDLKSKLTAHKRSLGFDVPALKAPGIINLYEEAKESLEEKSFKRKRIEKGTQLTFIRKSACKCVEYIENYIVDQGCRNHALVSVAIYYKNQGYTREQVLARLLELARSWEHDEGYAKIKSKVRSVFRIDYNFSCDYARAVLCTIDMENLCAQCPYNAKNQFKNTMTAVHSQIIEELWSNKASTRHYIAYLELSHKKLLNRWIKPEEHGLNERTIRELCKYTKLLNREKDKEQIFITNKAGGNVYYLPNRFMENEVYKLLDEHVKHYLKLIIKGYKPFNNYILVRVSKEKIMRDLGYSEITGVYKLLQKLKKQGLLIQKRNNVMCLYYESFKITSLQDYKAEKQNRNHVDISGSTNATTNMAVNSSAIVSQKTDSISNRGSPG